ncbi:hypothetical protein B7P43_G07806 [Cryptotermes secundus]|uniref:E3 ubiquitin-protein ligase n=1 Tax=Cryptotermes secundus TaxID=105785 RepID=A0A2J7QL72_9NEOP|nr:hypothetical protein B7P43_G07806 [Cryptotermes secundus]
MHALRTQNRNVDFIETGFTGLTDFVVRYSVTRKSFLLTRNCALEALADQCLERCGNVNVGCNFKRTNVQDIEKHMEVCSYRLYKCEYGRPGGCSWMGRRWQILDHMHEDHESITILLENNHCKIKDFLLYDHDLTTQVIMAHGEVFWLRHRKDSSKFKFFGAVQQSLTITSRNVALENIAETIVDSHSNKQLSVSLPQHRLYECLTGKSMGCTWKGRQSDLWSHVLLKHHRSAMHWKREIRLFRVSNHDFSVNGTSTLLISVFDQLFWYQLRQDSSKNRWCQAIQYIGSKKQAVTYKYTLEFGPVPDDSLKRTIVYSRATHPEEEHIDNIFKSSDLRGYTATLRLLAKMDANQVKTGAKQAKIYAYTRGKRGDMRAGQELLKEDMLAKLDAHHERMMARMDSELKEMEACLGKETTDLEENPEE